MSIMLSIYLGDSISLSKRRSRYLSNLCRCKYYYIISILPTYCMLLVFFHLNWWIYFELFSLFLRFDQFIAFIIPWMLVYLEKWSACKKAKIFFFSLAFNIKKNNVIKPFFICGYHSYIELYYCQNNLLKY